MRANSRNLSPKSLSSGATGLGSFGQGSSGCNFSEANGSAVFVLDFFGFSFALGPGGTPNQERP
jgi:hypothetical protein